MKIYTKTGDSGKTSLLSGKRVEKYHPRLHAYGTTDELNSWIGLLREYASPEIKAQLITIQETLFSMGSHLAVEGKVQKFEMPVLHHERVEELEQAIDAMNDALPELRNFILPGGHISVAQCHIARTVCRRAERYVVELAGTNDIPEIIVVFLNRLSDYLFVLARKFAADHAADEIPWKPK
jgi:cob(I)alamin adenosyltransferase